MAYPIVHLLVAAKCARGFCDPATPEYYLGAVAPDAIHMRPGMEKHIDKARTHLRARQDAGQKVRAYWDAVGRSPFHMGYGAHILTDRLWVAYYPDAMPGLISPDRRTIVSVYQADADWIDRMLLAREPMAAALLDQLGKADAPQDHPLLSPAEISGWRDRIVAQFSLPPVEPPGQPTAMRYEKVLGFIDQAAEALGHWDF